MSEQRKRLTDKEREWLMGVVHFNRPGDPIATRARAYLDADHIQAREDRKLLISLVSRSVAISSGTWSKAECEAWEEIRREVKP